MNYSYKYTLLLFCLLFSACQKEKITLNCESIDLSTAMNLRGVYFLSETEAYVGGGNKWETGYVWKTLDGGTTWETDTLEAQAVHKISAFDDRVILGTTTGRFVFQNAEKDWRYAQTGIPEYGWKPLFDVQQTKDSTLFAISGEGYYWGAIAKSVDKGLTWSYFMTEHQLFDLQMVNEQVGFAAGFGAIFKTENAGETWELLDLKGDIFKAVSFINTEIGFVVGDEGGIWKTSNGGESFETLRPANNFWNKRLHWNDVWLLNENEAWLAGEEAVWRTQNSGKDWEIIDDLPACNYRSIYLFDYEKAALVGDDGCLVFVKN